MIYIGADHGGFTQKEKLIEYLRGRGYKIEDMGTDSEEPVDYPLIAARAAKKMLEDPNNRGILLCRNGAGMCIAANKIKGVRAAQAWSADIARTARSDDNANILCLAADFMSPEEAQEVAQKFLDTSFAGHERYKRRINQIEQIEKGII